MIRNQAGQPVDAQVYASNGSDFGGTVTVYVTVDTAAQVLGTGTCTLKGSGQYQYIASAAETNGSLIGFQFRGSGALTVTIQIATETEAQNTAQTLATNPLVTPLTGVQLITDVLMVIGVLSSGDTPAGYMITDSFRGLNQMMGTLAIQPKTIPVIAREIFNLSSGKGSPANPYTIGPGGDLNTSRPLSLTGAGLLLNSSTPPVETPIGVLTDELWQMIAIKDLTSTLFTSVFLTASYSFGLAEINLWPVPTDLTNDLVLYRPVALSVFSSLTATYYVPTGYDEMLKYQLAMRLAIVFQKQLSAEAKEMAVTTLALVKRSNYTLFDLPTDPALTSNARGGYDIRTGNM